MDVLQKVKEIRGDIEVVVITAYGTSENSQEAFHLSARGFFPKPFGVREINDEVAKALVWQKYCLKVKKVKNLGCATNLWVRHLSAHPIFPEILPAVD